MGVGSCVTIWGIQGAFPNDRAVKSGGSQRFCLSCSPVAPVCLRDFVGRNLGRVEQNELVGHLRGRSAPVGGTDHRGRGGGVEVVVCVSPTSSRAIRLNPWTEGPVCWVLAKPWPLPQPVPFRGAQLRCEVPDDLILVAA